MSCKPGDFTMPPGFDLRRMGSHGATLVACYLANRVLRVREIVNAIGYSDGIVRDRLYEHARAGLLVNTNENHRGPTVWRITDIGRQTAREALVAEFDRIPEYLRQAEEDQATFMALLEPHIQNRISQAFADFGLDYISMRNSGKQPTGEPNDEGR